MPGLTVALVVLALLAGLLGGEQDALIPFTGAARYAELIPHARLVALPGVGHLPPEEVPAASVAALRQFLYSTGFDSRRLDSPRPDSPRLDSTLSIRPDDLRLFDSDRYFSLSPFSREPPMPTSVQAEAGTYSRWSGDRCGRCFIVPPDVLQRYSRDPSLSDAARRALRASFLETQRLLGLREAHRIATLRDPDRVGRGLLGAADEPAPHTPVQHLFDCKHRKNLPGTPVTQLADSFQTAFDTTARLVDFYRTVLGRNSVDDKGFDLVSSLHYGVDYDNAFWDGRQMVYGDGDGQLFTQMVSSPDVIGHELTHGVTQNESALRYEGESGALNESLSDVFGAVFNQWLNQWPTSEARGWLIGAGILAPAAKAKGFTCLRDMVAPSAAHCLSSQPERYDKIDPTADVHDNSGVPNKAFAGFARRLDGPSWGEAIQVWYAVCTDRALRADATFAEFAALTVAVAAHRGGAALGAACASAWAEVGVAAPPAAA